MKEKNKKIAKEKKEKIKKWHILILEDSVNEAESIERELRQAGMDCLALRVDSQNGFKKALKQSQPDIILADFKVPGFDGMTALKMARDLAPDVPFIFVSGSISEDKAIAALTLGAVDYIFKENLARLGPAVAMAMEDARLKRKKRESDKKLRCHAQELQLLSAAASAFVHINDLEKIYDYLAEVIRGVSGADYLMLSTYDEDLEAVRPKKIAGFEPFQEIISRRFGVDQTQMTFFLKDMRPDDFSDFVSRRLVKVRDGLYGLSNRKMSRLLCRTIEKKLDIGAIHTMGFSWENRLFGGLTVIIKKGGELRNHSHIEVLINMAAIAIKRLLAEESLRRLLREKEVLLKEIHHRVKNNLQIISGLLTLQADRAGAKPLADIFQESQDRIRSIALIHEKIYQSENLSEIDFSEYLRLLTGNLFTSHGLTTGRITVVFKLTSINLNIDKAFPLALIVNELVTNSLKHAFPGGKSGEIRIELHEVGDKGSASRAPMYELVVADNGIGLTAGFNLQSQKSLGMYLISILVKQLQATLAIESVQGAEFRIRFTTETKNSNGKNEN